MVRRFGIGGLVAATLLLLPLHALHGIDAGAFDLLRGLLAPSPDHPAEMLLHYLRLPRTLAALLLGACLAVAGTLFQAATRNPLASPGILGVTAGAQLFVSAAALLPGLAAIVPIPLAALSGGLAAGALTYLVSGGSRASPVRVALSGMAVSLMAGAGASALALLDETTGAGLHLWGGGSLVQSGWITPLGVAAGLLPALAMAALLARALDIMALGEDAARALGQNLALVRASVLFLGTWLSALAVTLAGPVVFVGLVAPNLVRLLGVTRHGVILPLAALTGASLTLGADLVVLWFSSTLVELPVGVPTAIIGAPFLIVLARRLAQEAVGPAREFSGRHRKPGRVGSWTGSWATAAWLVPLLLLALAAGLMAGNRWIGPAAIAALADGANGPLAAVLEMRAWRVVGSGLAGALLALSGLLLQGVVRNPLASPDLLGVTQGAGLLAVAAMVLLPGAGFLTVQAAALAGGLGIALLVALLGLRLSPSTLALMALGLAALAASVTSMLVIGAGFQASGLATWLAGSTYGADRGDILTLGAGLALVSPLAILCLGQADILAFGRTKAASLGLAVLRSELALLALGALAASLVAAVFGPVAFIGLMAPHAARLVRPGSFRELMGPAMGIGAAVMIVADLIGRSLLAPIEIPVGIMTAILGAPFILLVLRRG
ncbi:iron ABC transporter permease [Fulvimarina endophytica]|uniref:Iron ABC transporter permease n=1 Tax=Fulvimarina endophytica TaxID=2293836 RepID=A0A371WYG0_9HYPH|nr:iron ABC transporter permease [Fulvimarina endophytica]RFC62021.1 iron ABC transporter permease [Fulvimarina endophytica]